VNDEEFERQKARIQALADRWIRPVGLGWWSIDIDYERGPLEVNDKLEPKTIGATSVDWRYAHACITFNLSNVRDQSDADLERCFVHELMHVFLNEMRWARADDADHIDHEERVASTLTKAFLWLRDSLHLAARARACRRQRRGGAPAQVDEEAFLRP
jgi:hypothetical protein